MGKETIKKRVNGEVRIALFSRIDYGGDGYRRRLVERGFKIAEAEQVDFAVWCGGVVHKTATKERLKEEVAKEKLKPKETRRSQEEIIDYVRNKIADELAEQIPVIKRLGTQENVRLYVMTSPAYDGEFGEEIVERFARLRAEDVWHRAKWNEHLPLKPPPCEKFQEIVCLVPTKQTFRSKYDSTAVDRVVEDYLNLANKPYAPVVIIGCYNVFFYKPAGGESPLHIIALPGLSRIEENRASENQIGVTILRLTKDGNVFVKSHNLNDLVVRERESINVSPKYTKPEKQVLEEFKHRTWWTDGLLAEKLGIDRKKLKKILDGITKKRRLHPPLCFDDASNRYFIPRPWIQQNLTYLYPWPEKAFVEERFLSFGCLHAFCRHTAHRFMLDEVPKLMLEHDIRHLIGGGDFIEGRAHGIPENGELLLGADYVEQENFAAELVANALLRVFKQRLQGLVKNADKKLFTDDAAVFNFVKLTLPDFWYISGNHDEWTEKVAFPALTFFRVQLIKLLRQGTAETLRGTGLVVPVLLEEFLETNIVRMTPLDARMHPSGVSISLNHLHMGRAATKTLRSQHLLGATSADINIHANFHTALSMSRFDPKMGQRIIQQIGTLKLRSGFEDRKGKKVDFGVGYLRGGLVQQGDKKVILMHEVAFFGDPTKYQSLDNKTFIEAFKKDIEKISK